MRYSIIFGIIAILLLAGCVSPPEVKPEEPPVEPEEKCKTISENVPFVETVCSDVSYTEEICEIRKLGYTVVQNPVTHLCIGDSGCRGRPLSECAAVCTKAMTRCLMNITNDDNKTGTWTVGANFSLDSHGFIKDPISQAIDPGEGKSFDFHQIYNPGYPVTSAICKLIVYDEPTIYDCHEETRLKEVCEEETRYKTVQKEVCE